MVDLKEKLKKFNKRSMFDKTVMPLRDELWDHAFRLCRSEDNADDIIQEALLRSYKHWDSLRDEYGRKSWLHTIVANATNDFFRKKAIEKEVMVRLPDWMIENIPEEIIEEVVEEIQDERVLEALDKLSESTRVVTYLRYICNFSHSQIMDATGIKPHAIKRRLSRGKEKLREELGSGRKVV